jgi:hypothetical protein
VNGLWIIRSKTPNAARFDAVAAIKADRAERIRKITPRRR